MLVAAQRNAEVYRLERRCIAAPAPAVGFLERECFLDSQFARNRKTVPASGDGFAFPDFGSQHVPVQVDAIGLQTANGDSTTISTSAVTRAPFSATSLSISNNTLTEGKSSQLLAEWIWATHRSTASASGEDESGCPPKIFFGSPLAALTSAVFWLIHSARQA